MAILFDRGVEVTIARPQEGEFFKTEPNALIIRGFKVKFEVKRDLTNKANSCRIEISNLGEPLRAELQQKPLNIRLDAGYDDELERLFIGDLRWARSKKVPTGWLTTLQMGDGDRSLNHARTIRSYRSGIKAKTVLADLTKSMGLRIPTSVADAKELTGQFVGGLSFSGPSSKEITRLLTPKGMGWSVQDGTLQILREGESNGTQAIIISQATGMEGSPEFGPPTDKGKPPILKVRSRLKPGVSPGGVIQVESKFITGLFRVNRVVHSGDTHGTSFNSDIEARPL